MHRAVHSWSHLPTSFLGVSVIWIFKQIFALQRSDFWQPHAAPGISKRQVRSEVRTEGRWFSGFGWAEERIITLMQGLQMPERAQLTVRVITVTEWRTGWHRWKPEKEWRHTGNKWLSTHTPKKTTNMRWVRIRKAITTLQLLKTEKEQTYMCV